jgi:small ligand-binding sensory domain FIST
MATAAYAAALSEHPVAAQAIGEVLGTVLDAVGAGPDLACLFVTAPHTGVMEDMANAVQELLQPAAFVGATANAVLAGEHGVEDTPGVALFAASLDGHAARVVRLTADQTLDGWVIDGLPPDDTARAATLLLIPDPFTFPIDAFLAELRDVQPRLGVVGGLASAARGPGGNRLVVDGHVVNHGAVGVLLGEAPSVESVVSQGCRPIGQPFIVTKAERSALIELGGRPALDRLLEMVDGLTPEERASASNGLHCGIVVDEHKATFERGDFLIRGVLGADRQAKVVVIGDEVPVGSTVQFQVRDASTAAEDLSGLLAPHRADAALLFTCNGRGRAMFGTADHDPRVVQDTIGPLPVAGMFCAGELGPIGGRNAVHGFTASVALFGGKR